MEKKADGGEAEELIEETRRMLENTRAFLAHIREGEEATSRYVEGLTETLEKGLRRMERDRKPSETEEKDDPPPGLEGE